MSVYFGFAIADSMFVGNVLVSRKVVTVDIVQKLVARGVIPALNPSHTATVNAMKVRYGLNVTVPEKAPIVKLTIGDTLVVMSVRGLPRREGGVEYTEAEIDSATFEFSIWEVLA